MKRSIVALACVVAITSGCQTAASPAPTGSAPTASSSAASSTGPPVSIAPTTPGPSGVSAPTEPAHWVATGDPATGLLDHAVELGDGRVLGLSGSEETGVSNAEIWDPVTNEWRPTEGLNKYRSQFVAVPLADGHALVTGGENEDNVSFSSTYVFDPSSETWSKSGLLGTARTAPSAVTLKDGRVLVAGGYFNNGGPTGGIRPDAVLAAFVTGAGLYDVDIPTFAVAMATAELFDPATGTWSQTGPMTYARTGAPAVTLADGRVLVVGSEGWAGGGVEVDGRSHDSAEIYDPATGRFSLAGTLPPIDAAALEAKGPPNANPIPTDRPQIFPGSLVALQDGGAVLIGVTYSWKHQADMSRSFRYDATSNSWSEIGETWVVVGEPTAIPLFLEGVPNLIGSIAAPLSDGRVLVAGGSGPTHIVQTEYGDALESEPTDEASYFDPTANTWSDAPAMPAPSSGGDATALADGSVLAFGAGIFTDDGFVHITPARFVP
jgi:hypothetical protein